MESIEFNNKEYPMLQTTGFASRFAFPFAKEFCKGLGLDIGCHKTEWAFPNAVPIDLEFPDSYDAYNLPDGDWNYIYSSHCLEHLEDWVGALDYWFTVAPLVFLYLPHYEQEYWRPWNNRKHITAFYPEMLRDYFNDRGYKNFVTEGWDLNHSFYAVGSRD
jgi:hypothetical protein